MERIISELTTNMQHEINQIGLTPRTDFNGTQEEHDKYHRDMADKYDMAIRILTCKFQVRDWMVSEVCSFDTFDEAEIKFDELTSESDDHECDIQLLAVVREFNNVD